MGVDTGTSMLAGGPQWKWLEELRGRFELAIEVVDANLGFVMSAPLDLRRAPTLRPVLDNWRDPESRQYAETVLASGKSRSFTAGGLRVRALPLFTGGRGRSAPVGLLLVADAMPAAGEGPADPEALDRRLDAAGQWLTAAAEATVRAAIREGEQARAVQRLAGLIEIVQTIAKMESEPQVVSLIKDAIALWFDADVRVYRPDTTGAFVLHASLPGADTGEGQQRFAGRAISGRDDVFRFEPREIEEHALDARTADRLFVPIVVADSVEWLLTVGDGPFTEDLEATLRFLARFVTLHLGSLDRLGEDRIRQRLATILSFSDAPFNPTVRNALEAAAFELGAEAALVSLYYDREETPVLSVGWGRTPREAAPLVEPGALQAAPDRILVGGDAGNAVTITVEFLAGASEFPPGASRKAKAAVAVLGVWLSGALIRRTEEAAGAGPTYGWEFIGRLQGLVDKLGRVKVGGAMAILVPGALPEDTRTLDEVVALVQDQVRASDIIGVVESEGAGIFLPAATKDVASAVVGRLLHAVRKQGMGAARVGVVTCSPSSESPEALLQRALMNARLGPALS